MSDILRGTQEKYNPLRAFRFVLDFGMEGLDFWRVKSVSYSNGKLYVKVRETEELYHPEFFQNNKFKNRVVKLKFLSPIGIDVVETVFSGVTYKEYYAGEFDYDNDKPLMTDLVFTYKKVEHHTICQSQ